ncbi:MAG: hypothetical protein D6812_09785 [Deltaproteobacteria bacterium]|nr:MAG: hypothetical protein D6812_09785 [Deltaproteobacteria bacterium]
MGKSVQKTSISLPHPFPTRGIRSGIAPLAEKRSQATRSVQTLSAFGERGKGNATIGKGSIGRKIPRGVEPGGTIPPLAGKISDEGKGRIRRD